MLRSFLRAGAIGMALTAPAAAQPAPAQPSTSLSFADAVAMAERAAESVDVARADVDRARAQVSSARAGYLPTVNGSLQYQRTLASEFDDIVFGPPDMSTGDVELPFGQPNNWRVNVQATQPLFDGFRTSAAVSAAKSGVRVSELGLASTRAQVVLQVAQVYFDAALAQRQVEIAEITLQQTQQTLDETRLGFKQGATPEFDVVRAEVANENQQTALVRFRVQRDVLFVQLRRLIGVPLDRPLELSSKLEANDVDEIIAAARKAAGVASPARIAVAQDKEIVAMREDSLRIARADYLPTLSAGTDYGLVNYQNQPFNSDWRTNWTAGLTLSLPIFDGLRREANVKSSKADLHAARAQLENAREVSDVEQAQAAAAVAASRTQLDTTTRTVQQAQRTYEIAELRFSQGASTHLELIDARVQLEQSQLNQAAAERDLRIARLRQELLPALPLGAGGAP
jgi:outer membrane protein TolC